MLEVYFSLLVGSPQRRWFLDPERQATWGRVKGKTQRHEQSQNVLGGQD